MIHSPALNELSFSMTEVEKSNKLSKLNSALPTINVINPLIIKRSEDITADKNVENVFNKSQMTRQIESKFENIVEEHSSVKPQLTIDKAERDEKHSSKVEFNPLERK
jgi:hypothetical protein